MTKDTDKFNLKRVKVSLSVVVVLAVMAGIVQVLLLVLPTGDESGGASGSSAPVAETVPASSVSAEHGISSGDGSHEQGGRLDAASEASLQREKTELINDLRAVIVDGRPLSRGAAASVAALPRSSRSKVSYIDQMSTLPAGCEIVALAAALQGMGFDADPEDIADNHLSQSGNSSEVYGGSPYSDGAGLPPSIVKTAESWFDEHGGGLRAADATGTSIEALLLLADLGYPSVIWVTERFVQPSDINSMPDGMTWYFPEHSVVLYGAEADKLLISDSMSGLDARDRDEVEDIYKQCGSMAVVFLPE